MAGGSLMSRGQRSRNELLAGLPSPVPEDGYSAAIARGYGSLSSENFMSNNAKLTVALLALVISRSVDQVLFYRMNYMFSFYIFALSAFILPLAFIIISTPVVLYKLTRTSDITRRMRDFPWWKFAFMGLLDALFNITSTFPIQHIGGSMANVLSQMVLPVNMYVCITTFLPTIFFHSTFCTEQIFKIFIIFF